MSDEEAAARALWEMHLKSALLLVRDLRYKAAVVQHLDPRAVRVALKYALLVDDYLSFQHGLSAEEEKTLKALAQKLFDETPQVTQAQRRPH